MFRRFSIVAAALLLAATSSQATAPTLRAAFPGANGKILFMSDRNDPGGSVTTFVMNADGSGVTPITIGGTAAWSPGGTMIAFNMRTGDQYTNEIYTALANGTGVRRLTNNNVVDVHPRWSPDGGSLVFDRDSDIYTMRIDGTNERRLTTDPGNDWNPAWSPDGQWISFNSDRSGNFEIYKIRPDGTGLTRLTISAGDDYSPNWSPSGQQIAFTSGRTGNYEIFLMNADGTNFFNLTNNPADDERAAWSPDGTQLAFETYRDGDAEIYIMDANGGSPQNISLDYAFDFWPDWQPIPAFPLVDARFSPFNGDIVWLFNSGITKGCSAERFCSDDAVTRGQMAAFLARAMDLPAATADYFADDEISIFEADINRLAEAGITSGCGNGNYCPDLTITREQMAAYLDRALGLPSTATDFFTDDDVSIFEANINRVAAAGITKGCSTTTYCPLATVTRGQMAAFLHRAFGP